MLELQLSDVAVRIDVLEAAHSTGTPQVDVVGYTLYIQMRSFSIFIFVRRFDL